MIAINFEYTNRQHFFITAIKILCVQYLLQDVRILCIKIILK